MIKFEKVSKYSDLDVTLPKRATAASAGYDFAAAADVGVPSFAMLEDMMAHELEKRETIFDISESAYQLSEVSEFLKKAHARPTLIPTGIKCHLDSDKYLEISLRSSSPLKYLMILANGIGIIDADYYNNPDNEGEIFFQVLNLSPFPYIIHKGDKIGQGIIKEYLLTDDDVAAGSRTGGFGSTSEG